MSFSTLTISPESSARNLAIRAEKPTMSKWEYLNSMEESPKMTRMEYLNSLTNKEDNKPEPPNLEPKSSGDDTFYDEPMSLLSKKPSPWSTIGNNSCPRRRYYWITSACILILSCIVVVILVVTYSIQNRSSSDDDVNLVVSVGVSSLVYQYDEDVVLQVDMNYPKTSFWLGIWQSDRAPKERFTESDTLSALWIDLCLYSNDDSCPKDVTLDFNNTTEWKSDFDIEWPLCNGDWIACVIDDTTNRNLGCSPNFQIEGGTCDGVCVPATGSLSTARHLNPVPKSPLSRIAFGSSFDPSSQSDGALWQHMREVFQPDLWVWLGNNAYSSGYNIQLKRDIYNINKDDPYYSTYGPIAEPKIPVTGIW
jgi:hypothetical protein